MSAEVPRLFVFARHAESTANTAHALSSDPARPVALTERGRAQARALGAQLANVRIDLAVGTRFQRTQETIGIALHGRGVPVLIEPGFDELRAGDLDGAPVEAYRSWRRQHTLSDRLPHGESPDDAFGRCWPGPKRSRWSSCMSPRCAISRSPPTPTSHAGPPRRSATRSRFCSTSTPSGVPPRAWTPWPRPSSPARTPAARGGVGEVAGQTTARSVSR